MKISQSILLCAAALLIVASCKKSDPTPETPVEITVGTYILNSGSHNKNNASLTYYDIATKVTSQEFFLSKNGKKLGDGAQDVIIYGSKMYITVTNSGIIFVTDKQGVILEEITLDEYKSPRCLTAYNGKVYASYFDRGVVQIDTTSFATKSTPTGINAEELKVANGKLYVAISEGYQTPKGKTVVVIDPATMKEIKKIDVIENPAQIEVDRNNVVYLTSQGNHGNITAALQKINSTTDVATEITLPKEYGYVAHIAMGADDKLYILAGVSNASTDWKLVGKIYTYNTLTQEFESEFVTDGTIIDQMYCLSADPETGDVYVGTSDYENTGDIYAFGKDGKLKYKIPVGLNPMKVIPILGN